MSDIRLDIGSLKNFVMPVLSTFVNEDQDAAFDRIGVPLSELDKRIKGLSDLAGVSNFSSLCLSRS